MQSLGRHILVELYGCSPEAIDQVDHVEQAMLGAAEQAGATIIGSTFHYFNPQGVSGVVVIQESHLTIHSWPEYGYASIDIYTCGDTVDPWVAYKYLEEAFQATHGSSMEMLRGQKREMKSLDYQPDPQRDRASAKEEASTFDTWFTERDERIALSLKTDGRLYHALSPYQRVEVFKTEAYGNMLTLDGMVMTTEVDEVGYHEMLVHVPMLTLKSPKRVLVIGGGDGGTVREVVRHPAVEQVVMVEIDDKVVEASREHLPSIASALDHPKLDLRIEDGIKYVKQAADGSFDLVLVDSTDPVGPAEGLFTEDFYRGVHRLLTPHGVMVTQSESPRFNVKVHREIFDLYRTIFGAEQVWPYLTFIPTYPTGMWSFGYCSKGSAHPHQVDAQRQAQLLADHDLGYYNAAIHTAAFALPTFAQKQLS